MSKIQLRLDYTGAIDNPENTKRDFRKAMRIIIFSFLSSGILATGLFLAYKLLFPLIL